MIKRGDIVKSKQNGLYWKVGYISQKDGIMELFAYNPKPVMYPRFGSIVDKIFNYELA